MKPKVTASRPLIRSVQAPDLPVLADVHREAFRTEAWDEAALGDILAMPAAHGLLSCSDDGSWYSGFLLFTLVAEDAELLTLAVHPRAQRRGVGRNLMYAFLDSASAAGARQALLEVATDNPVAQRLYSRLGFSQVATRKNYYQRPGRRQVAAHLLRLSLATESGYVPW